MYFVYTTATVNTGGSGEITVGSGSNEKTLTYTKAWEVPTGEISDMVDNWIKTPDGITQVVFEESFKDVKVTNCSNWFDGLKNLTEIIGIENLNTSQVKYMVSMFDGCSKLESLDLSSFNTSGAANTASMFRDCSNLKQITFGNNFKTSNTESMFQGCSSLTELDLSSFDTSGAANTASMFRNCSSLEKITFGNNFKTSNTESMFSDCSKLTKLDLSSFNTSMVQNMSSMFSGCSGLTKLDLSSFNTSMVQNMNQMFFVCSSLTSLNLSSFNTSMVQNMYQMFSGCSSLSNLTLGSFDMSLATEKNNLDKMFDGCDKSNIAINGNALVFVTSDDQKGVWNGLNNVNFVEKEGDTYKYKGDITIDYSTGNETAPVVFSQKFTANSVTFTRTFTAGKPHTVCLPFAITNTAGYGTFYKLSGYDKDNRRVKFTKVEGATAANTPYLFIPDKNKADVTEIKVTDDVDISSTISETYSSYASNNFYTRFCGVYRKKTFTEQDLGGWYDYYGWTADGDFKKAGAGASVAPCRAYIMLEKETTGGSAPARLSVEFDDGETTGIGTIGTAKSGADGGADAPMYNLQGQRVGSGYKGVVIKNGKKMIVR